MGREQYDPAGQTEQAEAPAAEKLPAAQGDCNVGEHQLPAVQFVHCGIPSPENEPGWHWAFLVDFEPATQ